MRLSVLLLFVMIGLSATFCNRGNAIIIGNGDGNLSIYYSGEIKFNDDETAIQGMSPDGYVHYKRNERKVNAECNYHGQISYELEDNGRKLDINSEEGKKFLAIAIRDMIDAGFDARGRLERLYRRGGDKAVLSEVDLLKNDNIKAMYLSFLLHSDSLNRDEARIIIRKAGTEISSDFEKSGLLKDVPLTFLKDSSTSKAWFEAERTLGSDFEKANALRYFMMQQLSDEQVNDVIYADESLGSDFEKANILKDLINKTAFEDADVDRTLDAVNNIGSDFEKVNLYKLLIRKQKRSGENFDRMVDAASSLGGDFDKENLIRELIGPGIPEDANFEKLVGLVNHIGGEFERAGLIREILQKNVRKEQDWLSLIDCTAEIPSEFDKASLLEAIAEIMPKTDIVRNAYTRAAKTINSEVVYGRVIKALD
ncbi:MAG TPA: hypothetical protein VKR32_15675 [Puia sp.]|nr:hypothetical protein [Puia sp.]